MERIRNVLCNMNIECSDRQLEILAFYMDEIIMLNKSVNLTAITDRDDFIKKHYLDSLLAAPFPEFTNADRIIDVGSGAGFPGIPLAVIFPKKHFLLIDSLKKRIDVINRLCRRLGIENVEAVHGRAEDLARGKDMREIFDLCLSRAVANMSTLAEYCLPFVRVGGSFIAYKGSDFEDELRAASKAIEFLGGKIDRIERPKNPEISFNHGLVFISKVYRTPDEYPRKAGKPAKNPL